MKGLRVRVQREAVRIGCARRQRYRVGQGIQIDAQISRISPRLRRPVVRIRASPADALEGGFGKAVKGLYLKKGKRATTSRGESGVDVESYLKNSR